MQLKNLPFYRQSDLVDALKIPTGESIQAGEGYFQLRLTDMRLGRDWIAMSKYVPVFHSLLQGPTNRYEYIVDPIPPTDAPNQQGDLQRVYVDRHILTPLIPFTGRVHEIWLGLHAMVSRDLAADMLKLLKQIAVMAQKPEVVAAAELTEWLRNGVEVLLQSEGRKLAYKGQLEGNILQGMYYVIAPPDELKGKNNLQILDGRLVDDGQQVKFTDYFVVSLEVATERKDWIALPEIRPQYVAWRKAASQHQQNEDKTQYQQKLNDLLDGLEESPNLIKTHIHKIHKQLENSLKEIEKNTSSLYRNTEETIDNILIGDDSESFGTNE